jgi:hypothetical protein
MGLAMLAAVAVTDLAAQAQDSTTPPAYKRRLIGLPFISYSPETRWLFGAGGGLQFKWPSAVRDPGTRPSYLFGAATYTTRGQWSASSGLSLYTPANRWWFSGRVEGAYFPLSYYGIGPDAERADSNRMDNRLIKVEAKALRLVAGEFSVGPYYRLHSYFDIAWQDPASITAATPGGNGGVSSGLGLSLQLDARNSTTTPTRGHLLLMDYLRNASILGSDFDYDYILIDARLYLPVRRGRDVVALNLYGEFNGSEVPIQTMSMLSNVTTQELMRGVYLGRFRDQHEVVAQADYRGHIKGRFGYVLFGSAGNVFGSPGSSLTQNVKFTYGAGFRFNVNKADPLNLRVDFTLSSFGESGLTFGATEAF